MTFQQLNAENNLQEIIKSAFDADLPISGSWGYTKSLVTILGVSDIPLTQLEHMFASMRAYIEMNMTQAKATRYGSINLNENSRETFTIDNSMYHKITYDVTAMKESIYATFIEEYKEHYGKEGFDLSLHFQKRKEATLHREVVHWYKIN